MPIDRHLLPTDPPWLAKAFREIGVKEIAPGDTPRILEYHACTALGATTDEVPWCSSLVCWVMSECGITSTNSAAALSWLRWGRKLDTPQRGCLVIFERLDSDGIAIPHRGHVGFWLGESDGGVWVLGGNQRNSVRVSTYQRSRVIGYRWPSKPTNSTTNLASVGAAAGTATAVAPSVVSFLTTTKSTVDSVSDASAQVSSIWGKIAGTPSALLVMAGVCLTAAALWHIVRERNGKIKRLGV